MGSNPAAPISDESTPVVKGTRKGPFLLVDCSLIAFRPKGQGVERLRGREGNNQLIIHYGNDILRGGSGNDSLRGGTGDDSLSGGRESDHLSTPKGDDLMSHQPDFV